MAFHNPLLDGPMKTKIIRTLILQNIDNAVTIHEEKVNKFNIEHNVFFNQETKFENMQDNQAFLYSVLLYTELRIHPVVQPPQQK